MLCTAISRGPLLRDTTAASYADWQHTGRANTQEVQAPDEGADLAALCYFVGEFEVAIPQRPGGIEIHHILSAEVAELVSEPANSNNCCYSNYSAVVINRFLHSVNNFRTNPSRNGPKLMG
jgi:hypothetical protein